MATANLIPGFKDIDRFMSKVKINPDSGCWEWQAFIQERGYAMFSIKGKMYRAHRVSYYLHYGQPDINLEVDHKCRNRSCVRPDHLRVVDHQVNTTENSDGPTAINKRKTHCIRGHEFNKENTQLSLDGNRRCKVCIKINNANKYQEKTKNNIKRKYTKK